MTFEITDHVPGLTAQQVAALADEAEAGYDLTDAQPQPNPHFQRIQLVPTDLLEAIDERAEHDGQSPETVIRQALAQYLRSA